MAVTTQTDFDPVTLEILWSRLISIADESAAALLRTSFSTIVRESNDFATVLMDANGDSLSENTAGIPSFVGILPRTLKHLLAKYPLDQWKPGDCIITNDPWMATGHLPDITMAAPVFYKGELVAFSGSIAHSPDIGGSLWSADCRELYEEGLRIPPIKFLNEGQPNQDVFDFILGNVRVHEQVLGDLYAQVTANQVCHRRLIEFLEDAGMSDLRGLSAALQDRAELAMRNAIAAVRDGTYRAALDADGFDADETHIECAVTVDGSQLHVDYAGTSKQIERGLNSVMNYTYAYSVYPIKCALDPLTPRNEGSYRSVTVDAPLGSILNPHYPAPVNARQLTGHLLAGVIYAALAQAIPDKLIAECGGAPTLRSVYSGSDRQGNRFSQILFASGGMGASNVQDGLSTTAFPTNSGAGSIEAFESISPLIVWKKEFRPDSGGAGKFRGGLGQEIEVEVQSKEPLRLSLLSDRHKYAAQGLLGGKQGGKVEILLADGTRPHPKSRSGLKPGDRLIMRFGGGAGYGDPQGRDPARVRDDVKNGYVSAEAAERDYGIRPTVSRFGEGVGDISLEKRIRLGVDVGGTFTDFVLVDEHRDLIYTGKRLTTSSDPSEAITEGVQRLLREADTEIGQLHSIVHGTTLVANTIIERTGARIGLITTKGFRDSMEMGRETRYDLYDLFLQRPDTLVPRYLRREVAERVDPSGDVLLPFDSNEFRTVARGLVDEGVEAIAICFMHAYRNADHERQAKQILVDEFGGLPVTISSEVAPEIREFERTSTTCANAYVQPLMQRYLARLDSTLKTLGLSGTLYVMLSGGGITTVRAAREFPVRLIESGPAAGAMAASYYGLLTRTANMISFDMGGTTAKMCLIDRGWPEHAHEFEAGRVRRFRKGSGLPLKVPVVEMIEIGAGGGSLARIDEMGLLKVGPQSAGSQPGPVCYGLGGTRPAVTDADLVLGYLSPDYFLGGEMQLDLQSVEAAIDEHIARPLGLSVTEAAVGIHNVVNENMAAATRMHIAEKGRDPRRYALIAFGGAGPVHAYGLAKLLKLKRIICPFGAGVTSALGFLVAAPAIDFVRSYVSRLENLDWALLNSLFGEMEDEARALLVESGAAADQLTMSRTADMRYVGQGFEVTVPLPDGKLGPERLTDIRDYFFKTYQQLFERNITDVPVEAMSWRLAATAPVPNVELNFGGQPTAQVDPRKGTRQVYFAEAGFAPCTVYSRYSLKPGMHLQGPAVVEERESTTVIGPDATVSVDQYLNLIVDIQ